MSIKIEEYNNEKHDFSNLKLDSFGSSHVFIKDNQIIGRANMDVYDKEICINKINAEIKYLGHGRCMIESIIKNYNDRDLITGIYGTSSRGFWEKMNAILDENFEYEFYIQIDPSKNIKPQF